MEYKCGYVAVLGKPNAGKSTLVNSIIGEKVAIVSAKPQTTRNNIMGILTKDDYQIVFVDTPGIHKSKNALDKYMMKNVRSAIGGSNLILYLLDSTKKVLDEEIDYIKNLSERNEVPIVVVLSKIDLIQKDKLLPIIAKLSNTKEIEEIVPISSLKSKNKNELIDVILNYLPSSKEKQFIFDEDYYTDKSINFIISETIREKTLYYLEEEIPHGINVDVIKFEEQKNKDIIEADIICERDSHKSIIIGKQGSMIRTIGEKAREDLEKFLNKKIYLKLFVKTKKNWRDSENYLREFTLKKEEM